MKQYDYFVLGACSFGVKPFDYDNPNRVTFKQLPGEVENEYRFSKLLSDKLGCKEVNLSLGGVSNNYILRVLYNWISENKPIDKKVLMMVGLTELSRFEVFSTLAQQYVMTINPNSLSARVPNIIKRFLELTNLTKWVRERDISSYFEIFYKYFYDEVEEIKQLNRKLDMFQSYCEKHNIDVFFCSTMLSDVKLYNRNGEVYKNPNFKDFNTKDINYFKFPNDIVSWKEYIQTYDRNYRMEHPNIYDHEVITPLLFEYIEKL